MANIERLASSAAGEQQWRRVGELAVTAFVGILALAALAPPAITAAVGVVLLCSGLLLAAGLYLGRSSLSKSTIAWDLAALATFLGFVATLVSDASVSPL